MPTNKERLNISIVDPEIISELYNIRDTLEDITEDRLSFADVIKKLVLARPDFNTLTRRA